MSEKSSIGQNLQIPSSLRWGGICTTVEIPATTCKYIFQVCDQNGDPILARQRVSVGVVACTSAIAATDAGLGPKVPTAAEINNSALREDVAPAVIAANAEAVHLVKVGSADPAGNLHLAGVIGIHGQVQSYVYEGAAGTDTCQWLFETDTEGKFSIITTAFPANSALCICLASGKNFYFNGGAVA